MTERFHDRSEAGRVLAASLSAYARRRDVLVLALPRGGVPVAFQVARVLQAPLDLLLVRKLGVPGQEELAMGAIASGGARVINQEVVQALRIPDYIVDEVAVDEQRVLARREGMYRGHRAPLEVRGQIVILVDDGLATGSTMRVAVRALRQQNPARLIVAVPTAARETCAAFAGEVDEIICALTPEPFYAVGLWYEDFSQTDDEEVRALLESAAHGFNPPAINM